MTDRSPKQTFDQTYRKRRKIIGVMGSGVETHDTLAQEAGRTIADLGFHLLTGGGDGVMTSVSQAFAQTPSRSGLVIGVIRASKESRIDSSEGERPYLPNSPPNQWIEMPIFTHLPHSGKRGKEPTSRNHINVLTSDVVVALPGREGTLAEVMLALEYRWPLIFFVGSEAIGGKDPTDLVRQASGKVAIAGNASELRDLIQAFSSA